MNLLVFLEEKKVVSKIIFDWQNWKRKEFKNEI